LNFLEGDSSGSTTIKMPIPMTKRETEVVDIGFVVVCFERNPRGKERRVRGIHNMHDASICYE
jgi:hypothetical protein